MTYAFNPLDPMNKSMYLESAVPESIDQAIAMMPKYTVGPDSPSLRPQLTKDSWYYSNDSADDGKISAFEKLKAFVKGGTYNMIRGMFCNKNGFSLGRTLTTIAGITAVALTGPVGLALAGSIGLISAVDNFAKSVQKSNSAITDQEAREAFEGMGESVSTAGLSLFGGFKALKLIKRNFALSKANPAQKISFKDKLAKWDIRKLFKTNPQPSPTPNPSPTPPNSTTPNP
jgi:hypothetical protein